MPTPDLAQELATKFSQNVFGYLFDPAQCVGCFHLKARELAEIHVGYGHEDWKIVGQPELGSKFSVEPIETSDGHYLRIETEGEILATFSLKKDGEYTVISFEVY